MCAACCLTDYKAQGQTLAEAVFDLKNDNTIRGRDTHRKFCSFYVQLSRIQSLDRLHLFQPIQMSDLNFLPHEEMLTEMSRIQALSNQTLETWESEMQIKS